MSLDPVTVACIGMGWWSDVLADQYTISTIPHLLIFDGNGKLIRTMGGGSEMILREAIDRAKGLH